MVYAFELTVSRLKSEPYRTSKDLGELSFLDTFSQGFECSIL